LSDTDAACVAIALAVFLKKKKESLLDQRMVQKNTTVHTRKPEERLKGE
jgi:hypothetical protein